MKPVSQVLEEAADLLAKPGAWLQGEMALDASGRPTGPNSHVRPPVCFCLVGAVHHAQGRTHNDSPAIKFLQSTTRNVIWEWNDRISRTQPEVVAKLREAAALAKEQGR